MIMGCAYIWRIRIRGSLVVCAVCDGVRCGNAIPDEVLCTEGGGMEGRVLGIGIGVGVGKSRCESECESESESARS